MIHEIDELLSPNLIADLRQFSEQSSYVDGRVTNGTFRGKQNEQIEEYRVSESGYGEIIARALLANPKVATLTFPQAVSAVRFARYQSGMRYGPHVDAALMPARFGKIRTDLSCTAFLSDPEEYEGGELELWLGDERLRYKLQAGAAILYTSGLVHQVLPVTNGVRHVAVTWIQSLIPDPRHRTILTDLNNLILKASPKSTDAERLLLSGIRTQLFRLFAVPSVESYSDIVQGVD